MYLIPDYLPFAALIYYQIAVPFFTAGCHHPSPWVMIVLLLMANFSSDFMVLAGQNNSQVTKECVCLMEIWEWRPKLSKSLANF